MVVFPFALHITGPFPSYIVVAPYISAGKSLLLSRQSKMGRNSPLLFIRQLGDFRRRNLSVNQGNTNHKHLKKSAVFKKNLENG